VTRHEAFRVSRKVTAVAIGAALIGGLLWAGGYDYLLFHSLVEVLGVTVAGSIFIVAWNVRRRVDNAYILVAGMGYLFVGGMDLLHTLAYKGMGAIPSDGANLATQLWIAARYLEAGTFLAAPLLVGRRVRAPALLAGYGTVFTLLLLAIFLWHIFPVCFVDAEGPAHGLTPFKRASEGLVCLAFMAAIGLLLWKRSHFDRPVLHLLIGSLGVAIAAEVAFGLYADVYGVANMIGHGLKLVSYYLVYKALVEAMLVRPYDVLFRELRDSEQRFRRMFDESPVGAALETLDRRYQRVNDAFCRITGYPRNELLRMAASEVVHPDDRAAHAEQILDLLSGRIDELAGELRYLRKDGQTRWVHVSIRLLRDAAGHPAAFLPIVQDVTERRAAGEALQQHHDELERLITERTSELQESNLELEHEIAERREAEIALRRAHQATLDAREVERRHLARELHDSLGQELVVLGFTLETALARTRQGRLPLDELERAGDHVKSVIRQVREISHGLYPPALEQLGLAAALGHLADSSAAGARIRLECDDAAHARRFDETTEIALFRIAQEAVGNAIRHARPNQVVVRLTMENNTVTLTVTDDGCGFDPERVAGEGLGLTSIRDRAQAVGGTCYITSRPGRTCIEVRVPAEPPAPRREADQP